MRVNCITICLSVKLFLEIVLMFLNISHIRGDDWSASCASNCTCKWTNGKKSAICSSLQLTTIPTTLSTELQVLVLNDNHIPYLNREEFTNLGLLNLQRIYLKKSEVQYIHKETFKNLKILVEIDLSENKLEMIDKDTFMGNDRLRILYLNGNPLKKLVAYQFPILPHLRTLDLHDCLLSDVDPMALANLNLLEFLYFKNNLLESLSEYVFQHIINLKTLELDENPWQCNCKLRKFRNWYIHSKVNSISLLCKGPPAHKGKLWEIVEEDQFGCAPKVEVFNNEDVHNIEIGSNATFSCLVYGEPLPEVSWELNGKILDNENVVFEAESISSDKLWNNITVLNMTSLDAGTYSCMGFNVVGATSQNVSIYLTEIVQHVLVKTPETFWYFGLIMGTFGTVFFLILISFVVCLCKRTTRHRRHPNKSNIKASVSFNDQEKKLLDLSITTTTNERGESCGIDNNPNAISKTESVIGFEPIEIHAVESHRSNHGHHGVLMTSGGLHQLAHSQHSHLSGLNNVATSGTNTLISNRPQLLTVADGSCNVVGIPTSMAGSNVVHPNQIAEEFPLNVGVFPPPPEFCSTIASNPAYGNIFISVSVTQDMLDGGDLNMYPDLLNMTQRLPPENIAPQGALPPTCSTSPPPLPQTAAAINVSTFATLPRNTQRRGILKKDSSLQPTNLYPHDEIVGYHNLETGYSQGFQDHQQQQQQKQLANLLPPAAPSQCPLNHTQGTLSSKACAGCMNSIPSACNTPPMDATPLRPLCNPNMGNGCLKYDNMGRRITASGNSTLSLPDEERLENETHFIENKSSVIQSASVSSTSTPSPLVNCVNHTSNSNHNAKKQSQTCKEQGCQPSSNSLSVDIGGATEFVSL